MRFRVLNVIVAVLLLANMAGPQIVSSQEKKPYSIEEVEKLVKSGVISDERIKELLYENGLDFYPNEAAIARLKRAGAGDMVIQAVRMSEHPPAPEKPPLIPEEKVGKKKAFYKQWWFLGGLALLAGGTVALVAGGGEDGKEPPPPALPDFPDPPPKR